MKRGRKSDNELATMVVVSRHMPPPPPVELTDAQAQVWRDTAAAMAWLDRSSFPLLIELCRHVCRARLLEQRVAEFRMEWLKVDGGLQRLDRLLAMADRETRAISACARALRLTPQSRIEPRTAGRRVNDMPPDGPRPWDDDQ